ncbi:hypothetical protein M9H77_21450 [Catharanthus roseus]|uniref:Uncharacterized protein n=1 Tax=Catharanthus roseus TaxID=4058 RepID=A0ACC0AMC5_CATRO|nr:hypothetical protein M9H77_21450 [Catharanthus roseus]
MISIILLKTSLLNLRKADMEFQVKFILYITAKVLCSTMKYAHRSCWVRILCDTKKMEQLNWRVNIDMVDALGPKKDAAELEALRSRLDSFFVDVIEVKEIDTGCQNNQMVKIGEDARGQKQQRRKSFVNVTAFKMTDLQRLQDVVKSEMFQILWDLKKVPGDSVVKMVIHDCNQKQMRHLKPREWVDGEV